MSRRPIRQIGRLRLRSVPAVSNNATPVTYDWNFGDDTPHGTNQFATHTYRLPGTYIWTVIATVSGKSSVDAGLIMVGNPVQVEYCARGRFDYRFVAQYHH